MGAFHGYAHARGCQIDFHPRIADIGMGLEDFEGCERLFSNTNRFAGMSRWVSCLLVLTGLNG